MSLFRCQDCGQTWKLGESIVCPACGKASVRPDAPQAPKIRLVETPPEPAPQASVKAEAALRRIPWKIVLGVVLAGAILFGIKLLIVGGARKHEEPALTVAEDPQPPPAPKAGAPRPVPVPETPAKPEAVPSPAPVDPKETAAKAEPAPPKEAPTTPVPAPKEVPEPTATPKPAADPPRDLVGSWSFDEGTGTDVADASGCGNGGVLIGQGTRWIQGRVGNALQFDGKGGYVSCGLSRIPSPSQPQTLAFWVRIERAPDQAQVLISSTNDAQKSGVEAGFREGKLLISAWGGAELVSAPLPGLIDWHHCAYVFDGSTHLLYVDGKQAARSSTPVPASQPPSRLQFGRWTGGGNSFTGGVDEVRLYARPLSPEEIAALAAPASAAAAAPADPPGTVDLLKLIDPRRDSVAGAWSFAEGALWSPGTPWSRLQIPYVPPEEYDLTLLVTRTANVESLNIGMVGGGRQFLALLDGWGGSKSGLEMVDGKHAAENDTTVLRQLFTNDRRATVVCSVRKDGVRVAVDGTVVIDFKSGFKRLSLYPYWNVPSQESLMLGAYEAVWRFDSIKLRPVSGTGRALSSAAPEAPPREPENPRGPATSGVLSEYYEGVWTRLPDFSQLKPVRAARVDQIDTSQKIRPVLFAFRFTGYLRVIEDGEYTFYLNSTDGSRLLIGATEVVNNDLVHRLQEKSGTIKLKAGKHALTVEYFDQTRGEQLDVQWSGPGTPKGPLPKGALFYPDVPIPAVKAAPSTPVAPMKPEPPPEPVKSKEERIEQFKKDVAAKDEAVRLAAIQAARDLRDKGVRALLARKLESEPDAIRIAAAQALSFQKHPEAAAALGRGLVINQKNDGVAKAIITALGDLGMCAALPHLEAAITLNNGTLASDAFAQINRIGCPESAAGLVKLRKSAEDDYQKFYASQSGTGARTAPMTYNPKYPLAHLYSPIVTTLYKLMGVSTTQEEMERRIKKGEHLQNLATVYYCEETEKTFELTVAGPPRSCPLAPGVKSHADILLRHRKP